MTTETMLLLAFGWLWLASGISVASFAVPAGQPVARAAFVVAWPLLSIGVFIWWLHDWMKGTE